MLNFVIDRKGLIFSEVCMSLSLRVASPQTNRMLGKEKSAGGHLGA